MDCLMRILGKSRLERGVQRTHVPSSLGRHLWCFMISKLSFADSRQQFRQSSWIAPSRFAWIWCQSRLWGCDRQKSCAVARITTGSIGACTFPRQRAVENNGAFDSFDSCPIQTHFRTPLHRYQNEIARLITMRNTASVEKSYKVQ